MKTENDTKNVLGFYYSGERLKLGVKENMLIVTVLTVLLYSPLEWWCSI
jgi:hypothetical protein